MGQRVWTLPWSRCEPVTPSKGLFLWNGVFSVIVNGLFFIFCLFKKQTKFVALKNTVLLRADLSCWRLQLRHRCCQFIYFCKKWVNPGLFYRLFLVFYKQISLQFLQQIYVKKCPSSIRCQDSNPQPSEHEFPPLTTWPGLPPLPIYLIHGHFRSTNLTTSTSWTAPPFFSSGTRSKPSSATDISTKEVTQDLPMIANSWEMVRERERILLSRSQSHKRLSD